MCGKDELAPNRGKPGKIYASVSMTVRGAVSIVELLWRIPGVPLNYCNEFSEIDRRASFRCRGIL